MNEREKIITNNLPGEPGGDLAMCGAFENTERGAQLKPLIEQAIAEGKITPIEGISITDDEAFDAKVKEIMEVLGLSDDQKSVVESALSLIIVGKR